MAVGDSGRFSASHRADLLDLLELPRAVVLPESGEPTQLTLQVSRRLAETLEADRGPVDGVELDQRVDQLVGDPGPFGRGVQRLRAARW